jgi:pantoate--beta-alanine ligase
MYPGADVTTVHVDKLTRGLCGANRRGHFDGVTTVVMKLFNILPADVAFFGEKDYQQLVVIKQMVRDLNLAVEIVACPTMREADGLALSSRNAYLSPDERRQAQSLNRALQSAKEHVASGQRSVAPLVARIRKIIEDAGPAEIDYIEVVDPEDLTPVTEIRDRARICLAVRIGNCRLIDNVGVRR